MRERDTALFTVSVKAQMCVRIETDFVGRRLDSKAAISLLEAERYEKRAAGFLFLIGRTARTKRG